MSVGLNIIHSVVIVCFFRSKLLNSLFYQLGFLNSDSLPLLSSSSVASFCSYGPPRLVKMSFLLEVALVLSLSLLRIDGESCGRIPEPVNLPCSSVV